MNETINNSILCEISISNGCNLRNFGCNYLHGSFVKTPMSLSTSLSNIQNKQESELLISIIDDSYLGIWEFFSISESNNNKGNTKSQGISISNSILKYKFSIFNKDNKILINNNKLIRDISWSPSHLTSSKLSCMFAIALTKSIQIWGVKNEVNSTPELLHDIDLFESITTNTNHNTFIYNETTMNNNNTNIKNAMINSLHWHSCAVTSLVVFLSTGISLIITLPRYLTSEISI